MEERAHPNAENTTSYPPLPAPLVYQPPLDRLEPPLPIPLPPGRTTLPPPPGSETLVVQYPRDIVYRIPPPENSKIAESYLQQKQVKKGPKTCLWIFLAIVILGITLGVFFGIINAIYKPKLPEFAVANFIVKQLPPPRSKSQANPEYEITFKVTNPNERMDVLYGGNGHGWLTFKNRKVAHGNFSSFSQEAKKPSNLHVTLKGENVALPSEMANSMNNTKSKKPVSLGFKLYAKTKISSWVNRSDKDIVVWCEFKVNTLGKGTKVVNQDCSSQVQ